MDRKEEILKKAQDRKPYQMDEMELDILQKSSHVGMLAGLFACLALMAVKLLKDQPIQDVYAVFCSVLCGQYLYKWVRQKQKSMLFYGLLWGGVALLLFGVYVVKA